MPREITVTVHEIAVDGLPNLDGDGDLVCRIALLFDGCIVSGWPLGHGPNHDQGYSGLWEADGDVGHHRPFGGVTHWVEFPEPLHRLSPVYTFEAKR